MAQPAFGKSSLRPQLDLQVSPSLANSDDEQELAVADLLVAAAEGVVPNAKKFAKKLVQAGIGVDEAVAAVDDPASKRRGPLHLAAAAGNAEVCALLVEEFHAGVDATDIEGATPLIFAVQGMGSTAVVGLLLGYGADANKADNGGIAPLHIVAERGSYELAELLLSHGAEIDPICEKVGAPVHIAAENGNARVLKLLLQHDADCDRFSSLFNTPLAASVFGSSLECMEILIEAGADANSGSPETPLMIAAGKGSIDCIKCLLKAGADANIPDEIAMAQPAFGKSSLRPQLDLQVSPSLANSDDEQELAVADLLVAAAEGVVPNAKKFAKKLVQAGIGVDEAVAAVDDPGSKRRGPLHLAAAAGKAEVCALVVEEFHAGVDATDVEGATPLIFAVQGTGSTAVVGLLLGYGADANKADNGGIAPLHIVAERGSYELAELLLSQGAEIDPICEMVGAPVHIAHYGKPRICRVPKTLGKGQNTLTFSVTYMEYILKIC